MFLVEYVKIWRYNRDFSDIGDIRYPNFLTIRYIDIAQYRDISIFSIYRTALEDFDLLHVS